MFVICSQESVRSAQTFLTNREASVLDYLLKNEQKVVTKKRLEATLSEFDQELTANAVEQNISRLRRKLETSEANLQIATVRGVGYILTVPSK